MCRRRRQSIPSGIYAERRLKGVYERLGQLTLQNPSLNKWITECLNPNTWVKPKGKES